MDEGACVSLELAELSISLLASDVAIALRGHAYATLTVRILNFGYNRGVVPDGRGLPVYIPAANQVSQSTAQQVLLVRD